MTSLVASMQPGFFDYFRLAGDTITAWDERVTHRLNDVDETLTPWPELDVPPDVRIGCREFGLDGHGRLVWAEGNDRASVMFVLDNPGAREKPDGSPFFCGTRQTLRAAVVDADLDADGLYITFLIKCRPRRAYDKARARRIGLEYLTAQMRRRYPKIIVLFGDVVTKVVMQNENASVRTLRSLRLTTDGMPTVVTYHPLAARRRPNLYPLLTEDLAFARQWLNEI